MDYTNAYDLDPNDFSANLGLLACYRKLGRNDDYDRMVQKMITQAVGEISYRALRPISPEDAAFFQVLLAS